MWFIIQFFTFSWSFDQIAEEIIVIRALSLNRLRLSLNDLSSKLLLKLLF